MKVLNKGNGAGQNIPENTDIFIYLYILYIVNTSYTLNILNKHVQGTLNVKQSMQNETLKGLMV